MWEDIRKQMLAVERLSGTICRARIRYEKDEISLTRYRDIRLRLNRMIDGCLDPVVDEVIDDGPKEPTPEYTVIKYIPVDLTPMQVTNTIVPTLDHAILSYYRYRFPIKSILLFLKAMTGINDNSQCTEFMLLWKGHHGTYAVFIQRRFMRKQIEYGATQPNQAVTVNWKLDPCNVVGIDIDFDEHFDWDTLYPFCRLVARALKTIAGIRGYRAGVVYFFYSGGKGIHVYTAGIPGVDVTFLREYFRRALNVAGCPWFEKYFDWDKTESNSHLKTPFSTHLSSPYVATFIGTDTSELYLEKLTVHDELELKRNIARFNNSF